MRSERLIAWFHENRGRLPAERFELRPGETVSTPAVWAAALAADIRAGPTATICDVERTRQRWLPMLQDLADLKAVVESKDEHENRRAVGGVSVVAAGVSPAGRSLPCEAGQRAGVSS